MWGVCWTRKKGGNLYVPLISCTTSDEDRVIRFTPKQIRSMTSNFSTKKLIGVSEVASVYMCTLPDGRTAAVKKFVPGTMLQGEQEFMAQVNTMSSVHHPNLITLLGYCYTEKYQILVYEFAENGSLSHHLYGDSVLPWENRCKIALGVARALAYLHKDRKIVHRGIKPTNILLDNALEPKVADFGLTILLKDSPSAVIWSLEIAGYIAPDYKMTGKMIDMSDVYSFGILLLELLTGRRPFDRTIEPYECLLTWAKRQIFLALDNNDFSALVDSKLCDAYNKDDVLRMIVVIIFCIEFYPEYRPSMEKVAKLLERPRAPTPTEIIRYCRKFCAPSDWVDVSRT
ncbi:hypothetical protein ACHQM5_007183 [Ranunculus cassubicifolius]